MNDLIEYLSPYFAEATVCVMKGLAFGDKCIGRTFFLADGRFGTITDACSGAGLFVVLVILALIRLRLRNKISWGMLLATPFVSVAFNAIRCMIVIGRGISIHDLMGFAVFTIPVMVYALMPYGVVKSKSFRKCAMLVVAALGVWKSTPAYANGNKELITPTVRGITLGSPMETPTSVSLSWKADEGREIKPEQRVRVFWRDAYNKDWNMAVEGYGITNATVKGFFINRDTDWLVEVEALDEGEE